MNSSLIKLALLGTDSQSSDLSNPLLEPFADVFANPDNSVAKNVAFAMGIESLADQTSFRLNARNGESLFSLNDVDRRGFLPLEVADAILNVMEINLSMGNWTSERFLSWTFSPVVPILRAVVQHGLKFPPERATTFMSLFGSGNQAYVPNELVAVVAPPNVRELVRYEASLPTALRQIPIFLESYDVPLGVSIDEIERFFLDESTKIPMKALALNALRALSPDRGREAFEKLVDGSSRYSWRKFAMDLIPCLAIRLGENDAPFLRNALKKGGSSVACLAAGDLLARLRDPEYLKSIVSYADNHMTSTGKFSRPYVHSMKYLQRLGLYFGNARDPEESLIKALLQRIPLEHWEVFFKASPEEILVKTAGHDRFPYVLAGLCESYLFHGGPQRWEEPISRCLSARKDDGDAARWFGDALSQVDSKDTNALRAVVDRFCAKEVGPLSNGLLAATRFAFFEPYPWRDEFADFYDAAVWNELNRFGRNEAPPRPKIIPRGPYDSVLPKSPFSTWKRMPTLERLQDESGFFEPMDYGHRMGETDESWNATSEFARSLWSNTLTVLHLAPRRLRQKYSNLGKRLYERGVSTATRFYSSHGRLSNILLKSDFPMFAFEYLYRDSKFLKSVDVMEDYFLSLSRPE